MDWRASLCLLFLILSGCTSVETESPVATPHEQQRTGTASLTGTVLDIELRPLEGASVQALPVGAPEQGALVVSDADGRFRIDNLEAGRYAVEASRIGYRSALRQGVMVEAGGEANVGFVLEPLPSFEPHHETIPLPGTLTLGFYLMDPVVGRTGTALTSGGSLFKTILENETGPIVAMVAELYYTPTSAVCRGDIYSVVHGPTYNSGKPAAPDTWITAVENRSTESYLYVPRAGGHSNAMDSPERVSANGGQPLETTGRWLILSYSLSKGTLGTPVDYTCLQDQKFEQMWTIFYVADPPEDGWSSLPDN
jgi:hypothetical protein